MCVGWTAPCGVPVPRMAAGAPYTCPVTKPLIGAGGGVPLPRMAAAACKQSLERKRT